MHKTPIIFSTPNTRFESINAMIKEINEIRESTKLAMKSAQDKAKHYGNNIFYFTNLKLVIRCS